MLDYFLAILRPKTYVMADLAKGATETVPAWDGNPRGWRRYSREVLWYVMGTKKSSRPFLAPRLIAKLTGPARLLAMSWSQVDFRGKSGVKTLLTRLAESPLVRKNLPNTSAVMNQYFNYKRFPNETIANYLVRESLYFEEFNESLLALKEEQEGGLSQNIFDFSDSPSESDDEDEDGSTKKSKGYQKVPTSEPSPMGTMPVGSPEGRPTPPEGAPSVGRGSRASRPPLAPTLSSMDSFILKQLRGWRLLSGACLTAEEWRAVLSSTNNKLDYQNISMALTILYDDQIQSHRGGHQLHHGGAQLFSLEDGDWAWETPWWSDQDHWASYAGWPEEDEDWTMEEETEEAEGQGDDPKKENEAMAQTTWSQAHRTTQLVKKDRGFGKAVGKSGKASSASDGCHICGHPGHYARDCPDKFAPKGKGGRLHYVGAYDEENLYAFTKGKGKNYGKGGKKRLLCG